MCWKQLHFLVLQKSTIASKVINSDQVGIGSLLGVAKNLDIVHVQEP